MLFRDSYNKDPVFQYFFWKNFAAIVAFSLSEGHFLELHPVGGAACDVVYVCALRLHAG